MIIELSEKERLEMLKAWRSGKLDTSKIKKLQGMDNRLRPMTKEEAKRIIADL